MANVIQEANENRESKYADKGLLADLGTSFCIMDVGLSEGLYGPRWELEIFLADAEDLKTISFTRTPDRDSLFGSMKSDLPQHGCFLKKWTSKNGQRSGYDLEQSYDGGSCACNPAAPALPDGDPFTPVEEKPAPAPSFDTVPPAMHQYETFMALMQELQRPITPATTYAGMEKLIGELQVEVRERAPLNGQREVRREKGVPIR